MGTSISFNCMHCNEEIDADIEFAGNKAECPGCSKSIMVPNPEKDKSNRESLLKKYPDLQNRSEKELNSSLEFLKEYAKLYCKIQPTEDQNLRIISIAFKNGVGKALVKRYETASFAGTMQGSHQDSKKLHETLFSNKKLNKQLNQIMTGSGILMKKKKLFGIFG